MELWIRSQDKTHLHLITDINCTAGRIVSRGIILGIYATEQRAKEILDEIQKYLTPRIFIDKNDVVTQAPLVTVYEMPEK